jgi:hypothetical protein
LKENEVLVLKRCMTGNMSYGNFVYPDSGEVEAVDWIENNECGNGLHGWTLGADDYFDGTFFGNFVVILVNKDDGYVHLKNKVKFRKGTVLLNTPNMEEAHSLMLSVYPTMRLHWSVATQGVGSTATQGDSSTATQGSGSVATQGDESSATQGSGSVATQGDWSVATQGDGSTATQGGWSTAMQGYGSTATQGYGSAVTQGSKSVSVHHNVSLMSSIVRFAENSVAVLFSDDGTPNVYAQFKNETVYFFDGSPIARYTHTPDTIEALTEHEVFIFGSNMNGNHAWGAAQIAQEKFGAQDGVGEGLTGQSYAFPTLNENMAKRTKDELQESVKKLLVCTRKNTNKIFFLTKVGCGIAGYTEEEMRELFKDVKDANIIKPKDW